MADTVRDAFRAQLQSAMTAASIAWPLINTANSADDPDASAPYVTIRFAGGYESPYSFGSPGSNEWRDYQVAYVEFMIPAGDAASSTLAEGYSRSIRSYFRNRRFTTADNLKVRILAVNPLGEGKDERAFWDEGIAIEFRVIQIG